MQCLGLERRFDPDGDRAGGCAIWAVFYKGKPFNLKSGSLLASYPGPKYKKVSFSNPGHARNLAKKLNKLFKTNDFSVCKLTIGEEIK